MLPVPLLRHQIQRKPALNNGFMSLILNDLDAARSHWSRLNDPDRRRMFTMLYGLEMFIPKQVLASEEYARLLEDVGAGISWQRHLIEIVLEIAEVTGIKLNPKTRQHYDEDTYICVSIIFGQNKTGRKLLC